MKTFTLEADLTVNITEPGTYCEETDLSPGVINVGTQVCSHFFHSDPVGSPEPGKDYQGSATFDQHILGLIVMNEELDASDETLGNPTTVYPTGLGGRGYDLDYPGDPDCVPLSEDMRTVTVFAETSTATDQIRVLTECGYSGVANAEASAYGTRSLTTSGSFNALGLILVPLGASIAVRIWRGIGTCFQMVGE